MQTLEQGFNIARNAALLAGILKTGAGAVTVNRCAAQACRRCNDASRAIQDRDRDIFIIGDVEMGVGRRAQW